MVRRVRPGVLVVDDDAASRRRIAVLLGEAGIGVTAVADGAAARAALSRCRFDLAIVADGIVGADFTGRLGAIEIAPADRGEPRRLIGRVRDRLVGDDAEIGGAEAEVCIAAAKLACLDRRQNAARREGASDLVASLAREIAETAALQRLH